MDATTSVLFVTANVGSIFENPDVMLESWVREFVNSVVSSDAKFVALHCQEVGGKNYEIRMHHVRNFIQLLVHNDELRCFDRAEVFVDEDFSCAESFTALGNFYLIHEDVSRVELWNFDKLTFVPVTEKNIHAGNIEHVTTKEKSKFPQNFFPECKWSRKGYLRTRWNLNGTIFDLVNIHLFHDASNIVAMQTFPSVYTIMRQKALQYTLNRFYNYEDGPAPFFLFGDFNFRADTQSVIKKLVSGLDEYKEDESAGDDDSAKLHYKDETREVVLTVGKKEFNHADHQNIFIRDAGEWLKEFDRELDAFGDQLYEFPINFVPSYPFEENCDIANDYMKTRCPSWCDRVLLSINAKQLVHEIESGDNVEYGIIGSETCMGDHKPVYLRLNLVNGAGTVLPNFSSICSCKFCSSPLTAFVASPDSALRSCKVDLAQIRSNSLPVDSDAALLTRADVHWASETPIDEIIEMKRVVDRNRSYSDAWSCKWSMRTRSCSSETYFGGGRMRLKSDPELKISLPRIESHHSSSDEEWFEEVKENADEPQSTDNITAVVELSGRVFQEDVAESADLFLDDTKNTESDAKLGEKSSSHSGIPLVIENDHGDSSCFCFSKKKISTEKDLSKTGYRYYNKRKNKSRFKPCVIC